MKLQHLLPAALAALALAWGVLFASAAGATLHSLPLFDPGPETATLIVPPPPIGVTRADLHAAIESAGAIPGSSTRTDAMWAVEVTGDPLDRTAVINAVADAYGSLRGIYWLGDPDPDIAPSLAKTRLRNAITTLRSWSTDATATATAWDTLTQAQKDQRVKALFLRNGVFLDNLADLLVAIGVARD